MYSIYTTVPAATSFSFREIQSHCQTHFLQLYRSSIIYNINSTGKTFCSNVYVAVLLVRNFLVYTYRRRNLVRVCSTFLKYVGIAVNLDISNKFKIFELKTT